MSRVTAILAVLCGTWACTIPAAAQHELHNVPPVISPQGDNADYFQPFIDPNAFDPDFQFFAPADIDTYGDGPEPNIGWFATYDRVRIWVTRPDYVPSYTEGDFTWGNRFDLGYMSEEEHGWLVSIWHIDGPVAFDVLHPGAGQRLRGGRRNQRYPGCDHPAGRWWRRRWNDRHDAYSRLPDSGPQRSDHRPARLPGSQLASTWRI